MLEDSSAGIMIAYSDPTDVIYVPDMKCLEANMFQNYKDHSFFR